MPAYSGGRRERITELRPGSQKRPHAGMYLEITRMLGMRRDAAHLVGALSQDGGAAPYGRGSVKYAY